MWLFPFLYNLNRTVIPYLKIILLCPVVSQVTALQLTPRDPGRHLAATWKIAETARRDKHVHDTALTLLDKPNWCLICFHCDIPYRKCYQIFTISERPYHQLPKREPVAETRIQGEVSFDRPLSTGVLVGRWAPRVNSLVFCLSF
jgi:hypothetical protein